MRGIVHQSWLWCSSTKSLNLILSPSPSSHQERYSTPSSSSDDSLQVIVYVLWAELSWSSTVLCPAHRSGSPFSKIHMTNLRKTYQKVETYEHVIFKKNLWIYAKLMMTLQLSYENVKFVASDVIRETLWQRLLLDEYFELKITDNRSDDLQRMLSKNDLSFCLFLRGGLRPALRPSIKWHHFLKKILGSRILLTYKRLMKILRSFENRARVLLFSRYHIRIVCSSCCRQQAC